MGSKDIKNLCMGYDEKQRALMVYGYTGYIKDDWFAMPAFGRRYHEYGIADGSVLLCGPSESFCDGAQTPTIPRMEISASFIMKAKFRRRLWVPLISISDALSEMIALAKTLGLKCFGGKENNEQVSRIPEKI